jgi:hypothetical protein
MRNLLLVAAAAAFLAAPAAAVQITGQSAGPDNAINPFATGPGLLQVDYIIGRPGPITLTLAVEQGDEGGINFDSVILVDTGIVLGQTLKALKISLLGGPTFSTIGDVVANFSTPTVTGGPGDSMVRAVFLPSGEGDTVTLGNIDDFPGDFVIDLGGLQPGQTFQLVLSGAVPEASTWAMLVAGFGIVGAAVRRRRTAIAA